jgi:hypothetical protein
MHCEYQITFKDFLESMKAFRKVSKGAAFAYYLDIWIVPGIALLLLAYYVFAYLRGDRATVDTLAFLPILGVVGMIGPPIFYRVKLKQAFRQRSALTQDGQVTLDFDDTSLRFAILEKAEVTYTWASFTKFVESKNVATLLIKNLAFHTIPKRAMGDEAWTAFRELAHQHVGES